MSILTALRRPRVPQTPIRQPAATAARGNLIAAPDGTWAYYALADFEHDGAVGEVRDHAILDVVARLVDLTGHRVWVRGTSQEWHGEDYIAACEARYPSPIPDKPGGRSREELLTYAAALPEGSGRGMSVIVLGVRFTTRTVAREHLHHILADVPPPPPLGKVADDRAAYQRVTNVVSRAGLGAVPVTEEALMWLADTSLALGHDTGTIPDTPPAFRPVEVESEPYAPTLAVHAITGQASRTRHVAIRHLGYMPGWDTHTRFPLFAWLNARRVEWVACWDIHDGDAVVPVAREWAKTARDTARHDTAHDVDTDEGVQAGIDRAREVIAEVQHGEEAEACRAWGRVMVAVAGDTRAEAVTAADDLVSDARRHQHAPLEADYGLDADRWLFVPGEPWGPLRGDVGHLRRWPVAMLAAAGIAVTGHAGDQVGVPLGGIAGSASTYVWDPHGGPAMGRPGTWVAIAEQGGGKSSLASLVCDWSYSNGVQTRVWDPAGKMGRLARMPHAVGDVIEYPLSTAGKPGMLMPHFLDLDPKRSFYEPGPEGEEEWQDAVAGTKAVRMDRAIDATLIALPYKLMIRDPDIEAIVTAAVQKVGGEYGTHSREIIDAIERESVRGKEIADLLRARAESTDGAMVFPDRDVSDTVLNRLTSDAVGVIITTPGLSVPEDPDRATWQREHHRAALIMTLGWQLAVRDAWATTDPTTVWVDELGILMAGGLSSVSTSLRRMAFDSRKVNLSAGFGCQTPDPIYAVGDNIDGLIGSTFVGRTSLGTGRACLPLLGVPEGYGWEQRVTHLPLGDRREFLVSGWQREPAQPRQVLIDQQWWHRDLIEAANTTPPVHEAVIPDRLRAVALTGS